MAFKNPDDGTYFNNDVHLQEIGKKELSKNDISILQKLEKQNQIDYEDTYISEFLKCRNNIFYFIHNYCNIGEVGNPLLYSADMMNRKYRRVIKGLHRYHKAILMASRQLGKALDLNTEIPLFNGDFKLLKDVGVGDVLIDERGNPTTVVAVSPVFNDKICYRIKFDNQYETIASEDHLWTMSSTKHHFTNKILTTSELFDIFNSKTANHGRPFINIIDCVEYDKKDLLIPPYILGVWLGDGSSSAGCIASSLDDAPNTINNIKKSIEKNKKKYSISELYVYDNTKNCGVFTVCGLRTDLRKLGLFKNKHIPEDYLKASKYQRIQLLRGLMDTDGSVTKKGDCEFYQKDKDIIDSVIILLSSLGIKTRCRTKFLKGVKYYTVKFSTKKFYVFNLRRKRERQKLLKSHIKNTRVYLSEMNVVDCVPCKCIVVDSPSHLFLIGKQMIPTHNSTLAACISAHAATFFPGIKVVMFNKKIHIELK